MSTSDSEFRRLVKAWLYYHVTTERYDRTKNGYWIQTDVWMPIGWGSYESRRYARWLAERMKKELAGEKSQKAKEYVLKLSFSNQVELLNQMMKEEEEDDQCSQRTQDFTEEAGLGGRRGGEQVDLICTRGEKGH